MKTDYYIKLDLKDSKGESFKPKDVQDLKIQVFTNNIKDSVIITNFVEKDDGDYMALNAQDLANIESGVITYIYSWYTNDENFSDKKYNQSEVVYTNDYWQNPYQRIDKYDQLNGQFQCLLENVYSSLLTQKQIVEKLEEWYQVDKSTNQ